MDYNEQEENQEKIEFLQEIADGIESLVKLMCGKYGIDRQELMMQVFFGVVSENQKDLIQHVNYAAASRDELEYMLEVVSESYKEDTIDFWINNEGFSLN